MRLASILVMAVALPGAAQAQQCMVMNNMMMCNNGFMSFNATPIAAPPGLSGVTAFQTWGEPGPAPGATQWSQSQRFNPDGSRLERRETATRLPDGGVKRDVEERIIFPNGQSCRAEGGRMICD